MKKITKLFGILLLGVLIFSSCSKPKYTASFSPSKSKRYTKVEKPVNNSIEKNEVIVNNNQNTFASIEGVKLIETRLKSNTNNAELTIIKVIEPAFSKKEIRSLKKGVRKMVFREIRKSRPDKDTQLVAAIIALFIPPLGVWYYQKNITTDFWLALLLMFLFWLPGVIYAWLVIFGEFSLA